ncbi:MAG: hypothetical protein L3J62_06840 [Gammaproteobacteria bacterium]|nr:hypothetical protein [Gammaproteobacteria bacterium]MCF6230493.1 hypothetical protein [Gammaproteobacteria bacterium]
MNEKPEDLPTLQEPVDTFILEQDKIAIPILNEMIDQDALENTLFEGIEIPATLQAELSEQITHLLAQKVSDILPAIVSEAEQQITLALQQQISEQLPEIISSAIKASHN